MVKIYGEKKMMLLDNYGELALTEYHFGQARVGNLTHPMDLDNLDSLLIMKVPENCREVEK